jgi:hypothetical protein
MDTNGDRVITRDEWRGSPRSFTANDWNADGILSGDEVSKAWTESEFRGMDRNRDSRISRNEWPDELADFRLADTNNDDSLDLREFLAIGQPNRDMPSDPRRSRAMPRVVIVSGRTAWTDTGIDLREGDVIDVTATGRVFYARGRDDYAEPEGRAGRPATAAAPLPRRDIGALVARVADGPPFATGVALDNHRVTTGGRLYLGVNDDVLTDNSGEFRVNVTIVRR